MGWVTGIAVYVIVWWTVLFAVLPWGVRSDDQIVPGAMAGAPANPNLKLKALVTTGVSALLWVAIYLVVESGWISFRDMAGSVG